MAWPGNPPAAVGGIFQAVIENVEAVIINPLDHLNEEQLLDDVEHFARSTNLIDLLERLQRAARVAKNLASYDEDARGNREQGLPPLPVELTEDEKTALINEKDRLWTQSKGLTITVLTVSLAAFLQGHVQSSINGATLFFPQAYHIEGTATQKNYIVGATNAAPYLFAAVVGCPLVYPINRRIGRRGAILTAAALIFASSLGAAWTKEWRGLFACRVISGIGMGLKATSTPILASETAVSWWRGSAVLCWQLWVAFGIFIGFAVNLIANTAKPSLALQLILGSPFVPSLFLMILLKWCPESPRWHMAKGGPEDYRKAYEIFKRLTNTELQALRDLYLVHKQIELEAYTRRSYDDADAQQPSSADRHTLPPPQQQQRHQQHQNRNGLLVYGARFVQLFKYNRLRSALLACCTVMLAQQLCGINVLAFYSGTLFSAAGSNRRAALLWSLGFGLVNFTFGLPAIKSIDSYGRRTWLLRTLPLMSLTILIAGLCFLIKNQGSRIAGTAVFLFIFTALYSPGMGPMPFTISSESFPLSHREIGVAVSVAVNLFFAGVLTIFYLPLSTSVGNTGSLGIFAGLNLVAFTLIFLFLPETKQRSLEELDQVFAVPIRRFMTYQRTEVVPWFVNTYALCEYPTPKLRDLYDDQVWGPRARQQPQPNAVGPEDAALPARGGTLEMPGELPQIHEAQAAGGSRASSISSDNPHA